MMREVFRRRFARQLEENPDRDDATWPDLVLIDGGRGQLNAAKAVLEDLGIEDVCLVGVAKGPHHGREGREVFHMMDGSERMLPVNAPLLFYLQRLRDEVHRFVIGPPRQARQGDGRQPARRSAGDRPGAEEGVADALRHGARGTERESGGFAESAGGQPGGRAAGVRLYHSR